MRHMAKKFMTGVLIGMVATAGVALIAYALISASKVCGRSDTREIIAECTVVLR